uniref:hypothetical protein n=1 Tax=Xanthomonas sp. 0924 TaxID=2835534 RepID=UPI003F7D517D
MIAAAYLAIGILAAALLSLVTTSKDTTDSRKTLSAQVESIAFEEAQDAAAFDCFISRMQSEWEMRWYRVQEQRA